MLSIQTSQCWQSYVTTLFSYRTDCQRAAIGMRLDPAVNSTRMRYIRFPCARCMYRWPSAMVVVNCTTLRESSAFTGVKLPHCRTLTMRSISNCSGAVELTMSTSPPPSPHTFIAVAMSGVPRRSRNMETTDRTSERIGQASIHGQ